MASGAVGGMPDFESGFSRLLGIAAAAVLRNGA
jgi:hypothetical protein